MSSKHFEEENGYGHDMDFRFILQLTCFVFISSLHDVTIHKSPNEHIRRSPIINLDANATVSRETVKP